MTGNDFQINPEFAPLLREHGLDSFDAIMTYSQGTVMRSVPGRSTVRVQIGTQVAYLKRYQPPYYSWWQRLCGLDNEAGHEWDMIHVLRSHGFNTATAIARGRSGDSSFVMTAEIANGVPASDHARKLDPKQRRQFVLALADLTRRFHAAGFVHKDYYLHQVFVVETAGPTTLYLLDLQRTVGPGRFRPRWHAKDLGALGYSAQLAGANWTDLMRFYKRYSDKQRLDPADKRFIRVVARRVAHLHRRGPKYGEIWDQPGEHHPLANP